MTKADELRRLHRAPPILVLPNAWDAASARIFETEGFKAIATTSAGLAAALGYADGGMVPAREMIEGIARIARAVRVPVTADIEHAYATTPAEAAEVVLRTIAAGAAGVNIEDHVPGSDRLLPTTVQADKISAVVKAAATAGVPVVVNARTDGILRSVGEPSARIEDAIARGRAYLAAGADCVFVPGAVDRSTIAALVSGIGGPVNVLATAGTPPVSELESMGVARVSVGSGPMRAALALVRDVARELRDSGTYRAFTERALPYDEVNALMGGIEQPGDRI